MASLPEAFFRGFSGRHHPNPSPPSSASSRDKEDVGNEMVESMVTANEGTLDIS